MKKQIVLIFISCVVIIGFVYYHFNKPFGKPIHITLKVVDDLGHPVSNADIKGYLNDPRKNDDAGKHYDVITGEDGTYKIFGMGYSFTECSITKEGYYPSLYHIKLKNDDEYVDKLTMILKKIRNPIPMMVREVEFFLPSKEQYYAFDLDVGDLVEPYGTGKKPHIYIYYDGKFKDVFTGKSSFRVKVVKSREGLKLMNFDEYSKFKTAYSAPLNTYTNLLEFKSKRTKTERLVDTKIKKNEYIIFKVQNSTNSTMYNYGKILSDLSYWPQADKTVKIKFTYYYNPVPDNKNLEFDPKQNLIKTVNWRGRDNSDRFDP